MAKHYLVTRKISVYRKENSENIFITYYSPCGKKTRHEIQVKNGSISIPDLNTLLTWLKNYSINFEVAYLEISKLG